MFEYSIFVFQLTVAMHDFFLKTNMPKRPHFLYLFQGHELKECQGLPQQKPGEVRFLLCVFKYSDICTEHV